MNVKELLAWNKRDMWSFSDCNGIRTHKHLVRKRTLIHLYKLVSLAKWLSVLLQTWLLILFTNVVVGSNSIQTFIYKFACDVTITYFNRTVCIYQTATWWDSTTYWITICLIDDGVLIFVCLMIWFWVFIPAIWHGKPADSNSHRLSPLYYKRTH